MRTSTQPNYKLINLERSISLLSLDYLVSAVDISGLKLVAVEGLASFEDMRGIVGLKNPPFLGNLVGRCTHVAATLLDRRSELPILDRSAKPLVLSPEQEFAFEAEFRFSSYWFNVLSYSSDGRINNYCRLNWGDIAYNPNKGGKQRAPQVSLSRSINRKRCVVQFYTIIDPKLYPLVAQFVDRSMTQAVIKLFNPACEG